MDSNCEVEVELPYVSWYQCRMCTHIFLDDIEKMFTHLEKRHGAMIDCEELRGVVYKNRLKMGGPPGLIKLKEELDPTGEDEDVEGVNEQEPPALLPRPRYVENESGYGEDEMVLGIATGDYDDVEDGNSNYNDQNGDYDEDTYEDGEYQGVGLVNGVEVKYNYNVNDDEEQLPEDDPELNLNGFGEYENGENELEDEEGGEQYSNGSGEAEQEVCNNSTIGEDEEEQYNAAEYDNEGELEIEEGEIIASSGQAYSEEMGEEEEEDEDEQISIYDDADTDEHEANGNGNDLLQPASTAQQQQILNGFGHSCKFCGKFFSTRRGVETHEQHHRTQSVSRVAPSRRPEPRLFPCKLCKRKYFQSFKELKNHVKNHTDERIHICKFCCSTFNNTASLTKHLTIHKKENPNKCFCGKTFVSANTLKIHKKIHTGIKPFVCDFHQCGRAFVTKSTLESHLRTHTGEKPYQCSYCPSSFTTSSAKYRHERHVHKITDPNEME